MKNKVLVLPGDGIGPEVTAAAIKVLNKVAEKGNLKFEISYQDIGGSSIDKYGVPLTEQAINDALKADAVLLGAVGGTKWDSLPHSQKPETGLLSIRKALALFANLRPAKVYDELIESSSLKNNLIQGCDFLVYRELIGGIYFGEPRFYSPEESYNTMRYSKSEVERVAIMAFEAAKNRKKKLVSVDKANVLEVSRMWRETVVEISKDYPDVVLTNMYVDNAAMQIASNPLQFDVILTSNLFGDILSDLSGAITGSLGMLPSASLGYQSALYEPIHGSAPDIAGKNIANPIATINSVAMMLNHTFKRADLAKMVDVAVQKTLSLGYRTADIYSQGTQKVGTSEITEIILSNIK